MSSIDKLEICRLLQFLFIITKLEKQISKCPCKPIRWHNTWLLLDVYGWIKKKTTLYSSQIVFNLFSMCTPPSTTTQTKREADELSVRTSSTSFFSGRWSYSFLIYVCCFSILLNLYWFCDLLQIIVIVHSYRPSDVLCNKLYCLNLIL